MSEQTRWDGPVGVNVRGTVVVITGRGESSAVYQRFGARLAADAYQVVAIESDGRTTSDIEAQIRALQEDAWTTTPIVLAGSDSGASLALSLAAEIPGISAVVVAGLLTDDSRIPAGWDAQIEAKTACPTHQGVLRRAATEIDGAPVETGRPSVLSIPVLALHGSDDQISPLNSVLPIYEEFSTVTIKVVEGGRHDVLNDVSHRSVAATVVLFLESLKLGAELPEIVREVLTRSVRL